MQNWLTVTKYKKQRTVKRNTKLVTVAADFSAPKPRPKPTVATTTQQRHRSTVPIPFLIPIVSFHPQRQAGRQHPRYLSAFIYVVQLLRPYVCNVFITLTLRHCNYRSSQGCNTLPVISWIGAIGNVAIYLFCMCNLYLKRERLCRYFLLFYCSIVFYKHFMGFYNFQF